MVHLEATLLTNPDHYREAEMGSMTIYSHDSTIFSKNKISVSIYYSMRAYLTVDICIS
jgi:hypothetical protein